MKRRQKSIAFLLAALMVSGMVPGVSAMEPYAVTTNKTLKGDDRYKTAIEVSKSAFTNGSTKEAVLISGSAISDALSATPFAYSKNAPILLTEKNSLNLNTKAELKRLGVNKVYVVGGTNSVSDNVINQLKADNITVERISGNNRYETSLKVAKKMDASSDVSKIAVVNGNNGLPDAISVGAPAAREKMPILLTNGKSIPTDIDAWIKSETISKSYVIGGPNTVTEAVLNKLPNKERVSGDSRNDTNAKVIEKFYTAEDLKTVYVANDSMTSKNGDKLIDALAVGPVAAKNNASVAIVGNSLSAKQRELFLNKKFDTLIQVGGNVNANAAKELQDTQKSTIEVKTVTELKNAIARANNNEVINFKPSATVSESFTLTSSKAVTVNLYGTYTGTVTVDMNNGSVGNYGTMNKVVIDKIDSSSFMNNGTITNMEVRDTNGSKIVNNSSATLKKVQIYQDAKTVITGKVDEVVVEGKNATIELNGTVTKFEAKSTATGLKLENKGTVSDMKILANTASINNTGTITKLERQPDTYVYGGGTIGNETKPDSSSGVSSVRAVNAKQLEIKFSKAIDKDSVISGTDGLVNNTVILTNSSTATPADTGGAKATLDSARTTLTITLADNKAMKGNYFVDVNGLSSSSVKLDSYNGTFAASDLSAPTVTVGYNSVTDKFEFTLSEPIDGDTIASNIDLRIGGKIISTSAITANGKSLNATGVGVVSKFEVARSATDVDLGASTTVKVSGIKDDVNNMMVASSTNVTASKSSLSVSSMSQVDNDTIRITFNKELKVGTIPTTFDHDNNGSTDAVKTINIVNTSKTPNLEVRVANITQVANDKKSYDINLSSFTYPNDGSNQSLKVTIHPNYEFEDASGTKTKLDYKDKTITMVKDKIAPTASSVRLSTDRTGIEVTLSEKVKGVTTVGEAAKGKVTIFRNNVNLGSTTATLGADRKTVTVKTTNPNALVGGKLKSGTYYVRFEEGAFTDLNDVKSETIETNPITVAGEAVNVKLVNQSPEDIAANRFKIKLPNGSDETFTESSLSYKNYSINGKTIDSRAEISLVDNGKSIVVEIEDKIPATKSYRLVADNLSLVSGNEVNTLTTEVRLTDNCAPELLEGQLIKDNNAAEGHIKTDKLILTFDENIKFKNNKGTFVSEEIDINTLKEEITISAGTSTTSLTEVYNYGIGDGDSESDKAVYQVDGNRLILYIKHSSGGSEKSNWKDIIAKSKIRVTVKSDKIKDTQTDQNTSTKDMFVDLSTTSGSVTVPNATPVS